MFATTSIAQKWTGRLFSRRTGWIGVDAGAHSVKLAQVELACGRLQLRRRWILDYEDDRPLDRSTLEDGTFARSLQRFALAQGMFRGARTAFTLPAGMSQVRTLGLPPASREEQRAMIREELAEECGEELLFDFWEAGLPGNLSPRLMAAAVPAQLAQTAADGLLAGGLCSEILDAGPCVLARAVSLAEGGDAAQQPIAALDIGRSAAVLSISCGSRPVFHRLLRGCSLEFWHAALRDRLGVTDAEAAQLLQVYGVAPPGDKTAKPGAAAQILAGLLDQLIAELHLTIGFFQQQSAGHGPARIWLFGGGSLVRHLPAQLTASLGIATAPWRLAGDAGGLASDPLFGAAAALSTLAWSRTP